MVIALGICAWIAGRSGKEHGKAAAILMGCLIFPMAGNGIIIVSSTELFATIGCYMYYLGLDLSIAALLHFTIEYCGLSWPNKFLRNLIYGIFLMDVVQLLLNPVLHHAFELFPMQVDGYDYFRMIPHAGQTFHRVVDYVLLGGIIGVFAARAIRTPRLQKERYSVILITMILVTLWETAYIFSGAPIDRSMIGFGVFGLLVFYFSLYYRPMRLLDRMLSRIVSERLEPMFLFDDRQQCLWMNRSGRDLLKLGKEDLEKAGPALEALFGRRHPGEAEWEDQVVLMMEGEKRYLELSKVPYLDTNRKLNGFYFYVQDQTEEHRAMDRKLYNARHDGLTGLYNRDYLYERTRELLENNPEESYLVIRAEICDLNMVNDLYGSSFGDLALQRTADWIRQNTSARSTSGRLGGESFGLCVPEKLFHQYKVEEQLMEFLAEEGETRYHLMIHLGVYQVTDRSLECSVMYDRAQLAMESIRGQYGIRTAWYDETMRDKMLWNRQLSEELEDALADGSIRPFLQAVVDREGHLIGAEALVRWVHPEDGIRTPGMFIPIFERNGMIAEVDRCIWRKACEILARWKAEGKDLFLSINISPRDFYLMDVGKELKELVGKYGVDPSRLRLEITETVMMNDRENRIGLLRDLQSCGFLIEMDDFGSGYSSLNLLREMPVDVLKIDMEFIRKTAYNARAQAIVRKVIALARELQVTSLTEGVETESQFEGLREMGCELYQGYYFSQPIPVEEFEEQMK